MLYLCCEQVKNAAWKAIDWLGIGPSPNIVELGNNAVFLYHHQEIVAMATKLKRI